MRLKWSDWFDQLLNINDNFCLIIVCEMCCLETQSFKINTDEKKTQFVHSFLFFKLKLWFIYRNVRVSIPDQNNTKK